VTGYSSMRFTDGATWWQYIPVAPQATAVGTSLVYRRDWWLTHRFPEIQIGEDAGFVARAAAEGQLVTADAGEWMHATVHAGNTSKRDVSGTCWKEMIA
jgi:hypothetical protein